MEYVLTGLVLLVIGFVAYKKFFNKKKPLGSNGVGYGVGGGKPSDGSHPAKK